MNLAALTATAFRSIPGGVKGAVTVKRKTGGTFNRATETFSPGQTSSSFTASNGVVLPIDKDHVDKNLPVERQRLVMLAAKECSFVPEPNTMVATFNGHDWSITGVESLGPDGVTDVLYQLVVAR